MHGIRSKVDLNSAVKRLSSDKKPPPHKRWWRQQRIENAKLVENILAIGGF